MKLCVVEISFGWKMLNLYVKVNKPAQQDIKLDLDRVLEKVWNQGLPNSIFNPV
ncbi:MAG: hypothetical protein AAF383_22650 [Cyanobacteria bacterium P01_A01_bin.83]